MEQNKGNSKSLPKEWMYVSSHLIELILEDSSQGVTTWSPFRNTCDHATFISQTEPKYFSNMKNDEF